MWCVTRPLVTAFLALALAAADAEFSRAMQLAADGRFAEAEESLRALEIAQPKAFEVRYRLGLILLRQEKVKEAAQRFEAAVALAPASAIAWVGLAQARLKSLQPGPALEAAGHARKLAANEPTALRALAIFYVEAGKSHRISKQPAQAVDAYQNAIRLAPDRQEAYFELAALLLDHRTPQPAVAVLDSAAARFPKEPEFRRLLGLAHYQLGNIAQAIDAFFAVADLDPDSEVGYASLETLLPDAGPKLPEIIQRFRTFRTRQPATPVGHYLLARALTVTGAPIAEVEPLLRQAVQVDSTFWPAHYELAQQLETEGKLEEAVRAVTEAVRLNPQYAPGHFVLARLHARMGDRNRAIEHRKIHSDLLARQRDLAARARAESPALRYRTPNGR